VKLRNSLPYQFKAIDGDENEKDGNEKGKESL
jgi:hypothetical protein